MPVKLSELFAGTPVEVVRDGQVQTLGMLNSRCSGVLAPVGEEKYLRELSGADKVMAVITTPELAPFIPSHILLALATAPVEEFFSAHIRLCVSDFYWQDFKTEIHPKAFVHPAAIIAEKNVRIGAGSRISAGCVVCERVIIGERTIVYPCSTIGTDGYEVRAIEGARQVVPHGGGVRIWNDVTVQSHTAICRSLFGDFTEVGNGTVIDNLVHVAHNVVIGERCRIVAASMLGGSSTYGDDCYVGPNATISNGIKVGKRARVTLGAVVTRDVEDDGHVSGNFAIDHSRYLTFLKSIR